MAVAANSPSGDVVIPTMNSIISIVATIFLTIDFVDSAAVDRIVFIMPSIAITVTGATAETEPASPTIVRRGIDYATYTVFLPNSLIAIVAENLVTIIWFIAATDIAQITIFDVLTMTNRATD